MRHLVIRWLAPIAVTVSAAQSCTYGQQPSVGPPRTLPPSIQQAGFSSPPPKVAPPSIQLDRFPPLAQEFYRSGCGGAEWLCRINQPSGKFIPGWIPDLNQPIDGDHFLRQAGATFALARSARVLQDERYAVRARQAMLTLLAETGPDPSDVNSRCTTLPSAVVNRLGSAGLLLATICELPDPAKDLLDQGEQLARFIGRRQQADGSLRLTDTAEEIVDPDAINQYPGMALYGLIRSDSLRPAPWKAEVLRRAMAYYRNWWKEHKQPTFAAWQTAAFAEAYLQSKDRNRDAAYADFVFEMCDWLCARQIRQLDVRHPQWQGGFPDVVQGKSIAGTAPKATSAAYALALVEAGRVTRQKPDAERYARYREAAEAALQFTMTLQFTEANTQHFATNYRQNILIGGFHASPEDGTLRLDYTQYAVGALVKYWECVALPEANKR